VVAVIKVWWLVPWRCHLFRLSWGRNLRSVQVPGVQVEWLRPKSPATQRCTVHCRPSCSYPKCEES